MPKKPALPRGIRNHNPGNIRHSFSKWQGRRPEQTDPAFVQFSEPVFGIRAIAKVLMTYRRKGARSVKDVIECWAPAIENDTQAYVAAVALAVGKRPREAYDFLQRDALAALIKAIIQHENGVQPYGDDLIYLGVGMALDGR